MDLSYDKSNRLDKGTFQIMGQCQKSNTKVEITAKRFEASNSSLLSSQTGLPGLQQLPQQDHVGDPILFRSPHC